MPMQQQDLGDLLGRLENYMNNEGYKVVKLADGTKWFVTSEVIYQNGRYQYMIGLSDNEEEFLEKAQVMRVYHYQNQEYFDLVKDQELLKVLVPMLMPEVKEYIDNPDKLKELMED